MIRDDTRRFRQRPYYTSQELDSECERVVVEFLTSLHGKAEWPLDTNDLTKLIEFHVEDLDLYAALDPGVDGLTDFARGERPRVRISSALAAANQENRLRTTLTHELGHVLLHGSLYQLDEGTDLFEAAKAHDSDGKTISAPRSSCVQQCRRETILDAREVDWMEWQAGYACGAMLMPARPLRSVVETFVRARGLIAGVVEDSDHGRQLVDVVVRRFAVSSEAARVRLLKSALLLRPTQTPHLFG